MAKHKGKRNGDKPRTGASVESSKGALCPYCGKRSYFSRKFAKSAAKIQYPTEHLSPYRCKKAPEFVDTSRLWHLGHLAELVVKRGWDRDQVHRNAPEKPRPVPRPPSRPRDTVETTDNDQQKDDDA